MLDDERDDGSTASTGAGIQSIGRESARDEGPDRCPHCDQHNYTGWACMACEMAIELMAKHPGVARTVAEARILVDLLHAPVPHWRACSRGAVTLSGLLARDLVELRDGHFQLTAQARERLVR
jgi:hypothetical protein